MDSYTECWVCRTYLKTWRLGMVPLCQDHEPERERWQAEYDAGRVPPWWGKWGADE